MPHLLHHQFRSVLIVCVIAVGLSAPVVAARTLENYYLYLRIPGVTSYSKYSTPTESPPSVRVAGGYDPGPDVTSAGSFLSINRFVKYNASVLANEIIFAWPRVWEKDAACRYGGITFAPNIAVGTVIAEQQRWYRYIYYGSLQSGGYRYNVDPIKNDDPCVNDMPFAEWYTNDTFTFNTPIRRRAADGGEFDASPMVNVRNGQPWMTYYWGYRLGLVASESNWDPTNLSKVPELATWPAFPDPEDNVVLITLPPPWIEDDVVEYVNQKDFPKQPGGQFFYAVLAADKAALDAIASWRRTGKAFKSGGYVSVCRFYGGLNGGPNTHFYSADDKECAALKKVTVLSYEGQTFAVNMPMPAKTASQALPGALRDCPMKSKPLYRLYNNASAPGKDYVSNHRYVTEPADIVAAVAQGWVDEGHVMCVPE